jgi:Methyltransferase domain
MAQEDISSEIAEFEGLWEGGYYEGDPTVPVAKSSYRNFGYISTLYATYLRCIRPYITPETVALEIGPGRGTWTKGLLPAKEIWVMDALSAEHNGFFEYLKQPENVKYLQVEDFECRDLPVDHFDYMFSFGCLCHVSFDGVTAYAENIFDKLKPGANCFWMVADKKQYERFRKYADHYDIWKQLAPVRSKMAIFRSFFDLFSKVMMPDFMKKDDFAESQQGHWHDAGAERTCEMLESKGYKIIERDVGTVPRDPVIHFMKP